MALGDKIPDAAEDVLGKAKEAAGKITDNEDLIERGRGDQVKAHIMDDDSTPASDPDDTSD